MAVVTGIAVCYVVATISLKPKPDAPEYYAESFAIHLSNRTDTVTWEYQQALPLNKGRSLAFGLPFADSSQPKPKWEFQDPHKHYQATARGILISCTGYWDTFLGRKKEF